MALEWRDLTSSNLSAAAWDDETKQMHVRFNDGSTYAYPTASYQDYLGLITAGSPGKYFHNAIKFAHSGQPV
jgi:hypothetical protein